MNFISGPSDWSASRLLAGLDQQDLSIGSMRRGFIRRAMVINSGVSATNSTGGLRHPRADIGSACPIRLSMKIAALSGEAKGRALCIGSRDFVDTLKQMERRQSRLPARSCRGDTKAAVMSDSAVNCWEAPCPFFIEGVRPSLLDSLKRSSS